jgi:hypothetical protein
MAAVFRRALLKRTADRSDEPGVRRDSIAGRSRLDAGLERLGKAKSDAAGRLLPGAELCGVGRLVADDDELRLPTGQSNLDPARLELAADLERCLPRRSRRWR